MVEASTPRAIETEEVAEFVEQYRTAARNAIEAGKYIQTSIFQHRLQILFE